MPTSTFHARKGRRASIFPGRAKVGRPWGTSDGRVQESWRTSRCGEAGGTKGDGYQVQGDGGGGGGDGVIRGKRRYRERAK